MHKKSINKNLKKLSLSKKKKKIKLNKNINNLLVWNAVFLSSLVEYIIYVL